MTQEATNTATLREAGQAIEGIAHLLTQNAVRRDSEGPELFDGYTEGCLLAALNQLGKRVSEAGEV
jgi:hypothetical protein